MVLSVGDLVFEHEEGVVVHLDPLIMRTAHNFYVPLHFPELRTSRHAPDVRPPPANLIARIRAYLDNAGTSGACSRGE